MNARRLVIAGLALAVLIAVIAVVFDQLAVRPAQTTAQNSSSASPAAAGPSPTGSGEAGAGPQSSGSPTSGPSSGGDGGGASSSAKPLEVLPPVTATPTGLPEPSAAAPLLKGKLPDPGNATGAVVDGWPSSILTLPEGTTIGSTSVSGSGNVLQVTADGVVGKPQQAVIDDFRASLVPHGFWSEDAPAPDGATAARFVRGTDTVTVSVSTTGTGNSRFQLLGSLHSATE
ncbi:hypothetical protein [Paenarthrobacter ureafaciens]|jgi:hypothetical protein|uniref:hypothetical protein n=1 Tax=Paenarthrobacter ureafaciens TaxID=37931 RepID=UPI0014095F2D|nr:hypothetical protein [Paenarthrobacter ureafaciens]MCX8452753.1 hypothetical protein [Paenarthrobacter ureafaciens]MCY0971391.1 hypothetical protein [Paenarthrobacter ureafaciens]